MPGRDSRKPPPGGIASPVDTQAPQLTAEAPGIYKERSLEERNLLDQIAQTEEYLRDLRQRLRREEKISELKRGVDALRYEL